MLIFLVVLLSLTMGVTTGATEERDVFENDAAGAEGPLFVPGEIIVKFKPAVPQKAIGAINAQHGASILEASPWGFMRLSVPEGASVTGMAQAYSKNPNVEYAQANYICYADWVPDDPYYSYQWHLQMINMESAWDIELGGDVSVIVAVLDTGVAYEDYDEFIDNPGRGRDYWKTYQQAPDLALTSFVPGYDFINNDTHPNDDNAHGTHVTGTIAQSTNNAYGVAGVAFNTSIMPVKVLDESGTGTTATLADGLYYAADNGAHIINMSLGFASSVTEADIPAMTDAVAYAYGKGCIQVASSGNDGGGVVSLPAAYDQVIAVGAVNSADERAFYSQYGTDLEVVAPGGDDVDRNGDGYIDGVLQETFDPNTQDPTDFGFWFFYGTSMAAPHTSGLIALLLAQDPGRTLAEIRDILRESSADLGDPGWDAEYGYGRIDALAALSYTAVPNQPPVAEAGGPYTGDEGGPLTFDASGSSDIDGVITLYEWDWDNDGVYDESTTLATIAHTWSDDYVGIVGLRVTDDDGATATDTASVTVNNVDPTAEAGGPYSGDKGSAITLSGSATDPGADTFSYAWDLDNDGIYETPGQSVSNTWAQEGTYTVALQVTDDDGGVGTDIATVNVADLDPTAAFSYSPTKPIPGATVYFTDESTSYDGIDSWLWDFRDGTTSTLQNPTHIYETTGTYTVTLTVKEADLDSATAANDVVVSEGNIMHIASIDMSTETRTAGRNTFTTAVATVKIVDAAGNPVEGATVSGHWSGLTSDLDSGLTDASGLVVLKSDAVKNSSGTFTFTVDDVVLSGWIYDSSANVDFNGDGIAGDISNSITI